MLDKQLVEAFDLHRLADEADPQGVPGRARRASSPAWPPRASPMPALIDALPNLKVISSFGVGVDKIDLDAAAERGIPVGNTPDVLNDCVADLAFGLMIDVARGIGASERYLRAGSWPKGRLPAAARKVSGKKLGIVGLGRIGHAIAKRALAFDMDIRYHNRRPVIDTSIAHEPSLLELARWCDFLVVIVPGGAATQHLINEAVLDALGQQGLPDQRGARLGGRRAGAGARAARSAASPAPASTCSSNEPQVPAELMALDNVVLVPHIGSATVETRAAMAQRVFDNLKSFFATGKLVSQAAA